MTVSDEEMFSTAVDICQNLHPEMDHGLHNEPGFQYSGTVELYADPGVLALPSAKRAGRQTQIAFFIKGQAISEAEFFAHALPFYTALVSLSLLLPG